VFTATIHATEDTHVDDAITGLRTDCERAGLAPAMTELVTTQTKNVLEPLVEKGKELASLGSRMQVTRDISGDAYRVRLVFEAGGIRRSLFSRILDAIRSR
jgi:hypothetical protein